MFQSGPIVVNEGDNLRLRCGAAGYPMPTVEWKKVDKKNHITQGKWHGNYVVYFVQLVTMHTSTILQCCL